jgi:hypothetical protein
MERDGISEAEADAQVKEAKEQLAAALKAGDDPSDICQELFGLEPDYIEELIY